MLENASPGEPVVEVNEPVDAVRSRELRLAPAHRGVPEVVEPELLGRQVRLVMARESRLRRKDRLPRISIHLRKRSVLCGPVRLRVDEGEEAEFMDMRPRCCRRTVPQAAIHVRE